MATQDDRLGVAQRSERVPPYRDDRHVAIIGLGYVGLPLAVAFAQAGKTVTGVDVDARRVAQLNSGGSYIPDVPLEDVREVVQQGRFKATTDYDTLRACDVVFICVPTPYDAMRAPDLRYVVAAAEGIQPRLQRGQLVVLQSTTYPGTTEEVVLPILERSGLKAGADFDLAFSPERIDPGRRDWTVKNTPKVVGGLTPQATARAAALLGALGAPVHMVSSPRAAEMTKLLENIFRSVNIALVNELALLSERMGIDIWEVIRAASTKPFGFMPFTPGPGVGGHCIGVDPYYLSWKAREFDFYTKFIELAAEVNQSMPFHVVELTERALAQVHVPMRDARILVLGVAFKRDIDDARNSPAERVIELLLKRGATVRYHDPYVPCFRVGGDAFMRQPIELYSQPLTESLVRESDCVVIVTGHRVVDYAFVVRNARAVVDCMNATEGVAGDKRHVIRLGATPL
ncbi:MAG: nucleotide sugar dehydrogenase [Anaerolineae bacterium]|nr:nucleotide sugar dehydrogenase [Thermoflexales bacterium]MDW8053295.1 nucleotide sugar dehydrogenase [Anaerolineae bacterium]